MYEIEIYRNNWNEPVDMDAVHAAIVNLMADDQEDQYGRDARTSEKVYVKFGCVVEAVKRINALGYRTDEDEEDEEEDYRLD